MTYDHDLATNAVDEILAGLINPPEGLETLTEEYISNDGTDDLTEGSQEALDEIYDEIFERLEGNDLIPSDFHNHEMADELLDYIEDQLPLFFDNLNESYIILNEMIVA